MRINNNITALNTHRQFGINTSAVGRNMEKLSSGMRVNRAADDAAGLAISEKMCAQIRGLNQAARNVQDGISLFQVADGGLQTIQDIIQRMRELAVQAASDTFTENDRAALNAEYRQLLKELDHIVDTTEFNQIKPLRGSALGYPIDTAWQGTPMAGPIVNASVGGVSPVVSTWSPTPPSNAAINLLPITLPMLNELSGLSGLSWLSGLSELNGVNVSVVDSGVSVAEPSDLTNFSIPAGEALVIDADVLFESGTATVTNNHGGIRMQNNNARIETNHREARVEVSSGSLLSRIGNNDGTILVENGGSINDLNAINNYRIYVSEQANITISLNTATIISRGDSSIQTNRGYLEVGTWNGDRGTPANGSENGSAFVHLNEGGIIRNFSQNLNVERNIRGELVVIDPETGGHIGCECVGALSYKRIASLSSAFGWRFS